MLQVMVKLKKEKSQGNNKNQKKEGNLTKIYITMTRKALTSLVTMICPHCPQCSQAHTEAI